MALAVALVATGAVTSARPAAADRASSPAGPRRALAGQLTAGERHTCAIVLDGTVRCWGDNNVGQLGAPGVTALGDNEPVSSATPVDIGAGRTAVAISAGSSHTCVIRDDGAVMCWGSGGFGALGYGNQAIIGDDETPASVGTVALGAGRTAIDISAGGQFTCAVLDDGSLRCWGINQSGQLGAVIGNSSIGDNELPTAFPPIDLGAGRRATAVSAGGSHVCAILDDGSVRCWGSAFDGKLGQPGSTVDIGDDEPPSAFPVVSLGTGRRAVAIAAGFSHTCATLDNGRVRCWGAGNLGQLGTSTTVTIGDDELPSAGALVTLPGSGAGLALASGLGAAEMARVVPTPPKALSLATRHNHTCAVTDAGLVSCWGSGSKGQLGQGSIENIGDNESPGSLPGVNIGSGRRATVVAVGREHTCVLRDDAAVLCWGNGASGRLGYGNQQLVGDDEPPAVVGPVPLGIPVAASVAFSVKPSAEATASGALVSWGAPTAFTNVTGITVRASTGQSQALPVGSVSATFTLPAGVPVSFTVDLVTSGGPVSASTDVVVPGANGFVPVSPARILDTRIGLGANPAIVPAQGEVALQVAGEGGVPDTGVTAVVMNVTVTESAGPGFVTAYPSGGARPLASNLNVERAGQTIPNLVTVAVGADGKVNLFTSNATHLIADVAGYYEVAVGPVAAGRFVPVDPARILDTRAAGAIGSGDALELTVAGRGGVPATGAAAVVLNVTATEPSGAGFLTVFPTGEPRPTVSNLNFGLGQTIPNQVVVPVGSAGSVSVFAFTRTHVIVDVAGWITDAAQPELFSGLLVPVAPTRLLDTRSAGKVPGGASATVVVAGLPAVPAAVVLNVTATEATAPGFVTAHPAGAALPLASNLNVERAGQTIPNHVVVRTGTGGNVSLFSQTGTHLVADLAGWFLA